MTVTPAGGYEPTYPEIFVDDWTAAVRYDVMIANDSDEPFDASLFYATVQSGGREGEEAFDYDAGLDGAPETSIIPGDTVTFPIAYGVADPDDVVLELTPSMDYAEVIYTAP